jgi:CheY-like chemotaxis protein
MPLRQHLLIVDDQRVDRAIGTHAATQIGYRVSCAASIEETRALLETGNHFDFVVLDLALGAEDGLEVLPLIARFDPAAVVVLASSFDGRILAASQRLASGLGLRVAGVLRKPILPTALQRLLQLSPCALGHGGADPLSIPPEQLRQAIDMGQIAAWFQPQTSLDTGLVVGGSLSSLARS